MRFSMKGVVAAATLASLTGSAFAQSWSEDFEGYTVGDLLTPAATGNQNGWELWVPGIPSSVIAGTAQAGANSLEVVQGTDTVANYNSFGVAPTSGLYEFDAYVWHDANDMGEQFWIMLNTYAFGGPYSWSIQVHMDGTGGMVTCDCANNSTPNVVPLITGQWVLINAEIDLDNDYVNVYYNGTSLSDDTGSGIGPGPMGEGYVWTMGVFATAMGQLSVEGLDIYPDGGTPPDPIEWDSINLAPEVGPIGSTECSPGIPNSTGFSAGISAFGSDSVAANNVTLSTDNMPLNQFGYYLNSQTLSSPINPPGSSGNLCLIVQVGRYNGQVFNTGATGDSSLGLDLAQTPTPGGNVAIQPGETWYFTTWYRDGPTSNFSDVVKIDFN